MLVQGTYAHTHGVPPEVDTDGSAAGPVTPGLLATLPFFSVWLPPGAAISPHSDNEGLVGHHFPSAVGSQ